MIKKISIGIVLLALAGVMFWYAVCTKQIDAKDIEFVRKHSSTGLFPEVWLTEARLAYYADLDAEKAATYFRKAISMQPTLIAAWIGLAKAELALGHEGEASKVAGSVAPLIAHVSTWKWQELLLAYDMGKDDYFASCFNFILAKLPNRVNEACYLALSYWGGWGDVLPHVSAENNVVFLNELMKAKEADVALALWARTGEAGGGADKALQLRFCQFLMDNDRLRQAKEVWESWKGEGGSLIYDGSFDREPINAAFGWRFGKHPEVIIERTMETPRQGSYCLHLHFRGTKNISFSHVSQVVPVEPGKSYRLKFSQRTRGLTTDQGIFAAVSGYKCKGLWVQSRPLLGTTPWGEEELRFTVPEGCEAVLFQVIRRESLKFDSKLSGDYWLDAVELTQENNDE